MNSIASYFASWRRAASTTLVTTATVGTVVLAVGVPTASAATGPYGLTIDPSHAVLVAPTGNDDTGQGTEANPYRTIDKGVAVAAVLHENVYVAGGIYVESVTAQSGVGIYGGLDPSTWAQSPTETTTIQAPVGSEQAVFASGATNVVLEQITLRGPTGARWSHATSNSYGLRAINGSSVALLGVTTSGGQAASGLNGLTPASGLAPGSPGGAGNPPSPFSGSCTWSPAVGLGGSGFAGSSGGPGGAGGSDPNESPNNGAAGGDGLPSGVQLGGPGGLAQVGKGPDDNHNGHDGTPGGTGGIGLPGNGGPDQNGNHSGDPADWVGADGQPGGSGQAGHGGGGGGGGGGRHRDPTCVFSCTYYDSAGGSGGGGGGGGQGGAGGGGGQAGGASFGVYLEASTLVAHDSSIAGGNGGPGGNGAGGQTGAPGGAGGPGAPSIGCSLSTTAGGIGAAGGQGGTGGTGGAGAGGPSAAIDYVSGATSALRNTSTTVGEAGRPGTGGGGQAVGGQGSETIPAGTSSDSTLDFDHDSVPDVNDLCPTLPGGPTDLAHDGCPGSPSPVPQNTGLPTIGGSAVEGQTLTEGHSAWSNNPRSYVYQWSRCDASGSPCAAIPGASDVAYTLGAADVGSTIKVSEIASNSVGQSAPAWSGLTSTVLSGVPVNVAAPTVTGAPVAGQALAVQRGVWANNPSSFQYQWLRCDASGANCQPLPGQTGLSYGLTGRDVRSMIKVQEVASNGWGAAVPAISTSAGPVVDAPLTVETFALVGTAGSVVPGPIASFSQSSESGSGPGSYAATISWGDGSHSQGTVIVKHSGGYLVNGAHSYAKRGNYTLAVRVTAGTGASAVGTNRVSVFTAAVCPIRSAARRRNCLGDIALPAGCVAPGTSLRLAIPSAATVADVGYAIDHQSRFVEGRGPRFAAALSTAGLSSGTHRLIARITYRAGRPRKLYKARSFAVC